MKQASPICFRLLVQLICFALSLALERAGNSMLARMAMMAITTSSSMRVKPTLARRAFTTKKSVFESLAFIDNSWTLSYTVKKVPPVFDHNNKHSITKVGFQDREQVDLKHFYP